MATRVSSHSQMILKRIRKPQSYDEGELYIVCPKMDRIYANVQYVRPYQMEVGMSNKSNEY